MALLLALATGLLYLPVAWHGFCLYDDGAYVRENPMVQGGLTWAGCKWACTALAASNWHPLTWLSHMLDCGLFGLNPAGPHLVNAALHAMNAALLFALLHRLFQRPWPAAFIAALFAWHPMHVESVAWIAERKDVLSTFFGLLALLAYTRYVAARSEYHSRAGWFLGASLAAFALGLLAKPMLVTLPCLLLLLDFWPLRRFTLATFRWPLLVEKIPFFLLSAASVVITLISQTKAVSALALVPLRYRFQSVPVAYVRYIVKTFWPSKLAIFYPLPDVLPVVTVAVSVALLALVTALVIWQHRARPWLLTGWLWFLGLLVPVIGLVQVGSAQIADRYSYLSSIGLFIMATFGALELAARWRVPRGVLAGVAGGILLLMAGLTENQLRYWRSNIILFQHALAVTADNDTARNNLGIALEQAGRRDEAVEQYRAAVRLGSERYENHNNLANALDRQGQFAEGLVEHREAVRLGPDVPFLHYSLGLGLTHAGQPEAALAAFAEAVRLAPHYSWAHYKMAEIYLQRGQDDEALRELRAAVRTAPDRIENLTLAAHVLAASDNAAIRDGPAAFALAAKASVLSGGQDPHVLDILGMACAEMGKFEDAQTAAQQALAAAAATGMKDLAPLQQRLALYQQHQPWRESFQKETGSQ